MIAEATDIALTGRDMHALTLYSLESMHTDPDAPLLLFLHGFPDTARVWEPLMKALARDYALVAPFVHGTHVPAAIPPERYRLEAWCLDLLSLLQTLDPEHRREVFVVAHDLGGPYAQALAEYLGSRCKGLVFINSLGLAQYLSRIDKLQQWLKSYYIFLFQLRGVPEGLLRLLHPFALGRIYDLGGVAPDDPLRQENKSVFAGIEQYRQIFRQAPGLLLGSVPKSETPALFIWGESDPFLEIPSLNEVDRFYTQAEVRVLPGKHWILRSEAGKIAAYLQKFIQKWRNPT